VIFAGILIIQVPKVQTFIAAKIVSTLNDRLDADISFEKIHIRPFRTLILKNALIVDRNPVQDVDDPEKKQIDTFFRAEYITAEFSLEGLINPEGLHIDEVYISNAEMNLVLEDKEDSGDGDISTDNLSRIFRLKKPTKPTDGDKEIFHIKDVEISRMSFSMKNYGSQKIPYHGGINWDDLDIKDIHLIAEELQFKGGIMSGNAKHLSFREKSGYNTTSMSGSARVGRGKTIINELHIKDPWSDVYLPLFMMSYKNVYAFSDFISQVRIDGDIADSKLDFRTLAYFAPELEGNRLKTSISGKVSGYVDDFEMYGIRVTSSEGIFSGTVNGRMTGLPDIQQTSIRADIKGFNLTSEGLECFLNEWSKDRSIHLRDYAKGFIFTIDAEAVGLLNSLSVKTDINSLIGKVNADLGLKGILSEDGPVNISGRAVTNNLDIGKIISNDLIGPTTLKAGINADLGETSRIRLDSLFVDRLSLNRYDYSGIKASGSLSGDMFNGTIIVSDPALNLILQGGFALSAKTNNARYQFYANISNADLNAMNLDKRGKSKLRFQTNANFTKTGNGNMLGDIDIAGLTLENRDGTNRIGNINLTSHSNDDTYKIRLRSQFADAAFSGSAPVTQFVKDLSSITLEKEAPALFSSDQEWKGNNYNIEFISHDSRKLLAFIMPGLYINEGTSIKLNINDKGVLDASLNSQRIALGAQYIKDIKARFDNKNDSFNGELSASEAVFSGLTLNDNLLKILADDNHFGLSYSYDNHSELENRGELVINGTTARDNGVPAISIDILPSSLYLNSKEWNIQPSTISFKGKEIDIKAFEVISGEERIWADGATSNVRKDTLTVSLDRFDISILNSILGNNLGIKGAATGEISMTSQPGSKGLLANMICDSTFIADEPLGTLSLRSIWNEDFERFEIRLDNEHNGKNEITAKARFTPKSEMLDAVISLDSLRAVYAQPFLTDVFSRMDGFISGDIMIEGPLDKLQISSQDTHLDNAELTVAFTNVPYFADGPFHIDDKGVWFDDIRIRDRFDGSGTVEGSINWNMFKDFTFDTRIKVNSIEGINLTENLNEDFYGNIFGTGNVTITGPMNSLTLTVDAVTAKNGQLHIPMSGAATSGGSTNLLRFKEPEKVIYIDPYEEMRANLNRKEEEDSDFLVKLHVDASPNVEVFVEIDKTTGNVLSGRGNGLIELEVGEDIFLINGDYTLTGGKYNFSALGLVNRVFDIQDGSSINFKGDIMESTLNIDAIYNTKASLSSLIADDNSVSNRRNVLCGISITDELRNPRLEFSIDIPDLNPMIKSRVESALSTEDKVQKQFLSLLLSNSFLPDEQSGIVNNSSMLYSNVTEAMANQLSNILHKLDIPLDLGLNYQPSEQGNDMFDVAVSTQLFNNRVVVNGNIGNKQYSTGNTQNDVVGDLDIEIKLDRSGSFRLNIFSHSADIYSNYLDNSQRNGVGLTYQTEFNNIGQFLKNIFAGKTRRQEAKLAEEREAIDGEKVELRITREEYEKNKIKNGKRNKRKTVSDTVSTGRE